MVLVLLGAPFSEDIRLLMVSVSEYKCSALLGCSCQVQDVPLPKWIVKNSQMVGAAEPLPTHPHPWEYVYQCLDKPHMLPTSQSQRPWNESQQLWILGSISSQHGRGRTPSFLPPPPLDFRCPDAQNVIIYIVPSQGSGAIHLQGCHLHHHGIRTVNSVSSTTVTWVSVRGRAPIGLLRGEELI